MTHQPSLQVLDFVLVNRVIWRCPKRGWESPKFPKSKVGPTKVKDVTNADPKAGLNCFEDPNWGSNVFTKLENNTTGIEVVCLRN